MSQSIHELISKQFFKTCSKVFSVSFLLAILSIHFTLFIIWRLFQCHTWLIMTLSVPYLVYYMATLSVPYVVYHMATFAVPYWFYYIATLTAPYLVYSKYLLQCHTWIKTATLSAIILGLKQLRCHTWL